MSDVRALLLTDVVDSTQLSEKLGDHASAALWTAHDRVARDLLRSWRGREIDKTDGFLLLFGSAADATGYALAYHQAISALDVPLKARAGLHVGPVILRENSAADVALGAKSVEVEGIAKPIAARVMSIALGRQTLLTADAHKALGETSLRIRSHGYWRMKGVSEPVELFEVGDTDSGFVAPPDSEKAYRVMRQGDLWLPVRQIRHGLPAERDTFVGRHETMLELSRRLDDGARLVSVLGIGGSGKTRLVQQFAWRSLGEFPGGAWFCDLAQARSADGIIHAVAAALEVPLGKDDPIVQLGNAIAGRGRCLVILDNFEQVSRHAEETLGRWLNRASAAQFVVTTRDVLGLPGEQTIALPPLPPSDAVTLFVRRCQSAKHDFVATPEDEAAIDQLVKLLDGLPLAIELAAARIRVMSPKSLLARMSERFRVLGSSGGRRDRQATLRATFDWSWDLLPDSEKAALAQLSVFEGGFTLESAEAVLDLSAYSDAAWSADAVQSLLNKSFIRQGIGERFDLLVSVHEYAAEHLRTEARFPGSGAAALTSAEMRHAAYFAGLGEQRAVANRLAETDNLVAACRRAVANCAEHVVGALEGAWAALQLRGPMRAGVELASLALSTPRLELAARARIKRVAGKALEASGSKLEGRAHLDEALALARNVEDRRCEAQVLYDLGYLNESEGRMDEARTHYEAALALASRIDEPALQCLAQNGLGSLSEAQGQMDRARDHFEAALLIARRLGDRRREGRILANMGVLHLEQGRIDEGRTNYEAALAMAREVGDRQWEGNTLCNLGLLHQLEGRMPEARAELEGALALAREMGNPRLECIVLCNLGIVLESLDQLDPARSNFELALAIARELRDQRSEGQFLGYLALVHAKQGRLDEARQCLDKGERLLRAVSDRFSLGILQCSRAETEHLAGASEAAGAALTEAQSLANQLHAGPKSELGLAIARVLALRTEDR
jgi:predicted ATPase/class 3 adenylate cyclase/Tfp pilus assembly protein PilF